jgi:hypothetical protein
VPYIDRNILDIISPCLALQRIQRCVVGNFTGVVFDYVEDWNNPITSGLGLTLADYAANLAWAVSVAKNLGLAAAPQEGALVLAQSGAVPQLDMAISTSCMDYGNCQDYNVLGEREMLTMAAQPGSAPSAAVLAVNVWSSWVTEVN